MPGEPASPGLVRRFGLLQATALNMSNMIGVGPFITIPLLMSAMGGPQAMLGWVVALVIASADGMVWSELGAAMPGSGGATSICAKAFGRETLRPADGLPLHLAVHPQRPAGDRLRLHRFRADTCGYFWPGMTPPARLPCRRGRRRADHRPALPAASPRSARSRSACGSARC